MRLVSSTPDVPSIVLMERHRKNKKTICSLTTCDDLLLFVCVAVVAVAENNKNTSGKVCFTYGENK